MKEYDIIGSSYFMKPEKWLDSKAGQTVGLVHEILPAAEIVRRIVTEADGALRQGGNLIS